ncbi:MAG TPA: VWA domain-containing protein [Candidatus Marinimicrobia bacterium]|nr:VWA domain-containing protein [Candidatus Neomarinimicrobiota bacterium]
MINFRFPLVLLFYIPLVFMWLTWIIQTRKQKKVFENAEAGLQDNLFQRVDFRRIRWQKRLGIFGLLFLVFAASGPQIGTRLAPVERKGIDLVFAIDVSQSMDAEDVKPSRLEKAKFEISQMIRKLKGDRVALVVFAGTSHLYLPLTTDYEAAQLFLDGIDTGLIPTQGTDLSTAIQTGLSAFTEESEKYKVFVLITDGEDHEGAAIELAKKAADQNMIIHTVGVGTETGSLIPLISNDGTREYKRDKQGKLVTSILNEPLLRDIANAGNGIFVRFDNRTASYREILNAINSMEKRTIQSHVYSEFEDRYQSFALISFVLLSISMILPTRKKEERTWRGRIV